MHDPVHVVDVVLEKVFGGVDRDHRLERWRIARCHLDRIEAAPGDAEHPDIAVRPRLLREPVDDDFAVLLLDLGILVGNQPAFAVAGAADVHGRNDIPALHEVGIEGVVAAARLVLAVGEVLEQYGKFLATCAAGWLVQVRRQADAIRHGNPVGANFDAVSRGFFRRGRRGEGGQQEDRNEKTERCHRGRLIGLPVFLQISIKNNQIRFIKTSV